MLPPPAAVVRLARLTSRSGAAEGLVGAQRRAWAGVKDGLGGRGERSGRGGAWGGVLPVWSDSFLLELAVLAASLL